MSDDTHGNDLPAKPQPTPEEIADFERAVQKLIRVRAPFDPHMRALKDLMAEKEQRGGDPDDGAA